jgi:site-specific recombinase XerD
VELDQSLAIAGATDPAVTEPTTREAAAEAVRLKGKAKADSTTRAYDGRWRTFLNWCARQEPRLDPLPASEATAALFVGYLSLQGATPSTVYGYTAAIRHHHRRAGHQSPFLGLDVQEVIEGHAREAGVAPSQVAPIQTVQVRRIIAAIDVSTLVGLRDRAMILTAYAGAFRRSELVAIDRAQLHRDEGKGYRIWLPKSKADQRGEGQWRFICHGEHPLTCPVTAIDRWLSAAGIREGRVFRAINKHDQPWGDGVTPQVFATIIKKRAAAVDLDPAAFAGHSTRRGFATQATTNGVARQQIMKDGGWSSSAVDRYIAPVEGWDNAASGHLGL